MLLKLKIWYEALTSLQQLIIILLANWILWFICFLLEDKVFYEEKRQLTHHIFDATFMALFMTPLYAWGKVKAVFKSKVVDQMTNDVDKQQ